MTKLLPKDDLIQLLSDLDDTRLYTYAERLKLAKAVGAAKGNKIIGGADGVNIILQRLGIRFFVVVGLDEDEYLFSNGRKVFNPHYMNYYWLVISYVEM